MLRLVLRLLKILSLMVVGAVLAVLIVYVLHARSFPPLEPWHARAFIDTVAPELDDMRDVTLESYLARENQIFQRLDEAVRRVGPRGERARWLRYNPDGPANPLRYPVNWNRTQVLPVDDPIGGVLLVHGLSDSPYSLRALTERLHDMGYYTIDLRMPGHGTVPGALRVVRWEDWRDAYEIGARHLAGVIGPDKPLILVGYSNGAALAVDHATRALEGEVARRPDRLILISPAVLAPSVAAFAYLQRWISMLPGLEKLAWTDILLEYDPYKYNSFPVMAGEQIFELTSQLQDRLGELDLAGRLAEFPPVLAFVSVVDATIAPDSSIDSLFDRLPHTGSELVLFDVNRYAAVAEFLKQDHEVLLQRLHDRDSLPFDYTLVTNVDESTDQVLARTRLADSRETTEEPLGLAWPPGVYSLSHVALPIPLDDPIYGAPDADAHNVIRLGELAARGERGVFGVPMDQLARLRFNPFFAYLETRVEAALQSPTP